MTRFERLEEAIKLTVISGFLGVVGLIVLFWIVIAVAVLVLSPVLLLPLGLLALPVALFYFASRPKTKENGPESFGWRSESSDDDGAATYARAEEQAARAEYRPERPKDGEPGWYEDPNSPGWLRYWGGRNWTNRERRGPT